MQGASVGFIQAADQTNNRENIPHAQQVVRADNTCSLLSHAGWFSIHILGGGKDFIRLSCFVLG